MDAQALAQFLWDHGHFWNPKCPNALNVKQGDLLLLDSGAKAYQEAVASYQEADANLVGYSWAIHKRAPMYDGITGPATMATASLKRCPMPDHPPPPHATFQYADPALQRAVESYQRSAAATGSGSWPAQGCDPLHTGGHSIRVNIDLSRCPATIKGYIAQSLAAVVAAYADIGLAVRYLHDGSEAEIVKQFESLPGSVIGWNEFPQPGTCNQDVQGRLDTQFIPDMEEWANLECHETGHGVRLEHTQGGIMNPSLIRFWPLNWRTTPSFPTLKRYFGGEPIAPPTPPGPPIEPNTVRLASAFAAGTYAGGITFGSAMGAGLYRMLLQGDGPPPPVPPDDEPERRRLVGRLIAHARASGRSDVAARIDVAVGTLPFLTVFLTLLPFIVGMISGQPLDWAAILKALTDLFSPA